MNTTSCSSTEERRNFSRIVFDGTAHISQGNHQWQTKLLDLSLKGLLIEQPGNWDIDNRQPLQATVPLGGEVAISMEVNWRHSHIGQVGFECAHIDIDSISHLRRLVELNLGSEALLERELAALGR